MLDPVRITVEDLLARRTKPGPAVVSVAPSAAVRQALNLMRTWDVSQLPVLEGGTCVGRLVDGPVMAAALGQPALLDRPVREIMEEPLPVVEASMSSDRLAPLLTRDNPATLVSKDGKLIGIVSRFDILEQLIGAR